MNDWAVQRVDVTSATDDELRPLHDLWVEEEAERYPGDPEPPVDESLDYLRNSSSRFMQLTHWTGQSPGSDDAAGWIELRMRQEDEANPHLCGVELFVRAAHRRQGLGSRLLATALDAAIATGRTTVTARTQWDGPYEPFLTRLGLDRRYRERYSRLHLDEVDAGLLTSWVDRAAERAGDYTLQSWRGRTPDDVVEAWATARDIMNTAPREGLEDNDWHTTPDMIRDEDDRLERSGEDHWVTYARHEPTGMIAGYTELYLGPFRPWMVWQGRTAVDPAHRERGLGRWVKAAMLQQLMADRPATRWVETDNAGSNEPMLAINDALGFRPVRWVGVWQGPIDRAQEVLGRAHATAG